MIRFALLACCGIAHLFAAPVYADDEADLMALVKEAQKLEQSGKSKDAAPDRVSGAGEELAWR